MKISMKGRYALRSMADLATHNNGRPVSIRDIAAIDDAMRGVVDAVTLADWQKESVNNDVN